MNDERIEIAEKLGLSDRINDIPELARMDRSAVGWFRILLWGTLGLLVGLAWLIVELLLLGFIWRTVLPLAVDVALSISPNGWSMNSGIGSGAWYFLMNGILPGEMGGFRLKGEWWLWVVLLAGVAFFLYQSKGVREQLTNLTLWPSGDPPPWPLRLIIQGARGLTWAAILLFIGGFLVLAFTPVIRFGAVMVEWIGILQSNWDEVRELLAAYWYYLAGGLLVLALFLYALRHRLKGKVMRTLVVLTGLAGFADMVRQVAFYGEYNWLILVVFSIMLVYPIGLAVQLSKITVPPFNVFRNALYWVYQHVRYKLRLERGIAHHRKRNLQLTKSRIWASVCKNDLVRFEAHTERLSYGRWITYGSCPVCNDDHKAYNQVDCMVLSVDETMEEPVMQEGPNLWMNGMSWLRANDGAAVPVFDTVLVGKSDTHLVEGMVVRYNNYTLTPRHRPLKDIPVRVRAGIDLDQNILRMLSENCNAVLPGFADGRVSTRNWEAYDMVRYQTRRAKKSFQVVGCAVLTLVAVGAGLAAIYLFVPDAQENMQRFWGQLQNVWIEVQKLVP